jgi:hypothetical protein
MQWQSHCLAQAEQAAGPGVVAQQAIDDATAIAMLRHKQ